MGTSYEELVQVVDSKVSAARAIEHLLKKDEFRDLFDSVDTAEQQKLAEWITNLNRDKLKQWLRNQLVDLWTLPVRELRVRARECNIEDAHLKTKAELISELENVT